MKRILTSIALATALAASGVALAGPASAQSAPATSSAAAPAAAAATSIHRVSCTSYGYTWIVSNQTTCWANAGTVNVTLYNVTQINSGNNTGYVICASGRRYNFPTRNVSYLLPYVETVKTIHIY